MNNEISIKSFVPESKQLLPFAGFIHLLEANGFKIGVDNFLSLQTLLNSIDPSCPKERLKTYIRPIFCTTPDEQHKFDQLFNDYFNVNMPVLNIGKGNQIKRTAFQEPVIEPEEPDNRKRLNAVLYFLIGAIVIMIVVAYFFGGDFLGPVINKNPQLTGDTAIDKLILIVVVLLTVLLLFFNLILKIIANRKKAQEKLGLDLDRLRKPMLYWKIEVPETRLSLFSSNAFFNTTRLLKSRELSEVRYLDVSKTIWATINNMGFPKLKYAFRTKFPEYLILIDKASYRDHQASYFEALFQSLNEQEIYAERYFYRNIPNVCWDENDNGIQLEELFRKYHSHRVVIMGDLIHLFDSMTGKLNAQLMPLLYWRYKAILTTNDPPAKFVEALQDYGEFITAKATIENLLSLQEAIQASEQITYTSGSSTARLNTSLQHLSEDQIIQKLKLRLDRTSFDWLCVCAVYPELNWPFTLYLGKQVLGEAKLTESRIMELVQLPWYREGAFPEKLRGKLINELSEDLIQKTRQVIFDWIRDNPPQVDDIKSQNDYQLYIAMEASMLDPDDPQKKEWLQSQVGKPQNQGSPFREIILHYLEDKSAKETTLSLPGWMNNLFKVGDERSIDDETEIKIYPKANLLRRALAKGIDWTIVFLIVLIEFFIASLSDTLLQSAWTGIFLLSQFYILMVLIEGATNGVGKRMMGLVCVDVKRNKKSNLKSAAIRYLNVLLISGVFLWVLLAGLNVVDTFTKVYWIVGVLIFLNIIFDIILVIGSDTGQHKLDRLAGIQVVNKADFYSGHKVSIKETASKEAPSFTSEETGLFIYPKVDFDKRLIAEVIDYFGAFGAASVFGLVLLVFDWLDYLSESAGNIIMIFAFLTFIIFKVVVDPLFGGLGKKQLNLISININTNQKNTVLTSLFKNLDFILLFTGFWIITFVVATELAILIYLAVVVVLVVINNLLVASSKNGRSYMDRILGIQTVYNLDYIAGNYLGREEVKMPESMESNIAEQKAHDTIQESKQTVEQFSFYTEDEIFKKAIELTKLGPDKILLIFSTRKQKTWLVSVGNEILCLLDDAKTRSTDGRILQWSYKVKPGEKLYVKAKRSKRARLSGLLDIGNRRNWLYSYSLHPNTEKFEQEVRDLIVNGSIVDENLAEEGNIANDIFTESEAPESSQSFEQSASYEQPQSTGTFSKEEPSTDWRDLSDSDLIRKVLNTKIEDAGNFLNELRRNDPHRARMLYQKINNEEIISLIDKWSLSNLGHVLNELSAIDQKKTKELYYLVNEDVLINKLKKLDTEDIGPSLRYLLDIDAKKTNEIIAKDEYLRSTLLEFERSRKENLSSNIDQSSEGTINVEYIDLRIQYIQNMLENDKIEDALENTLEICQEFGDESYKKTVLFLLGSYTKIIKDSALNLLTKEKAEREKSRIISAAYDLLTQLKRDYDIQKGFKK